MITLTNENKSTEDSKEAEFEKEALPYIDELYGKALQYTKNEKDAEDLVQQTLLKAYKHWDKYENGTNCRAWLYKILYNTFVNKYRKNGKRKEVLINDENRRPFEEQAKTEQKHPFVADIENEQEMCYKMFSDEVAEALSEVQENFRLVIILADIMNFAYKEIANILDCPVGTVMSRLYRGRKQMRRQLTHVALEYGIIHDPEPFLKDGTNRTQKSTRKRKMKEKEHEE